MAVLQQFLQGSWQSQGTLYLPGCGHEDATSAAATTLALRLLESVMLKGCHTFLKSSKGHVARPEESWGDGQEGVFQEYKMWRLAWYKCACGSLVYLSRNTETWPSLGQHEKNKNKNKNSSFFTPKRQKTECELAKIFFLWKHCVRLLSLDSASLLGIMS